MKKRIIIGVSGASGIPVAVDILREIKETKEFESHLVVSDGARKTIEAETSITLNELKRLADWNYENDDFAAGIASGSFRSEGMIIVPCSMKTVSGIANGFSDNLLLRAADVMLKERRKLILIVRECPLNGIHLKNLLLLNQMGADILPLVMTFYNKPERIEDMVRHMTGKALEKFGLDTKGFKRWKD